MHALEAGTQLPGWQKTLYRYELVWKSSYAIFNLLRISAKIHGPATLTGSNLSNRKRHFADHGEAARVHRRGEHDQLGQQVFIWLQVATSMMAYHSMLSIPQDSCHNQGLQSCC
jgi:hypothetical protein